MWGTANREKILEAHLHRIVVICATGIKSVTFAKSIFFGTVQVDTYRYKMAI